MALKKQIELPSGVIAEYWRISALTRPLGKNIISLEGFKDKAARDGKKTPLAKRTCVCINIDSIEEAYQFIKTQIEFSGAENC